MITAKKTTITLVLLLALSLSGNAFMGGLLLANSKVLPAPEFLKGGPGNNKGPGEQRMGQALAFLAQLPPDIRRQVGDSFRAEKDNIRAMMDEVKAARENVLAEIRAEDFNSERLANMLAEQRAKQAAVQVHIHNILLKNIEGLTHEQRLVLADKVSRQLFR